MRILLLLSLLNAAAAETFVGVPEVTPTTVAAGSFITVTYALSGGSYPTTAYIVGELAYNTGYSWTSYPLLGQSNSGSQVSGTVSAASVSSGNYFIVLRTSNGVWSTGKAITVVLGGAFLSTPSVEPSTLLHAGSTITVSFQLSTPASVTAYMVSELAYNTGVSWTSYPLLSQTSFDSQLSGTISDSSVSSGNYYVVLRTSTGVWSTGVPVRVIAIQFTSTPSASPSTVSAGVLVTATFSLNIQTPVTAFVVGATSYAIGPGSGWTSYPLLNPSSSDSQISGTISAASVSSGSYYIVLRTSTGVWSSGAPILVGPVTIQVSPTAFSPYDSITVSWPAGGVTYPTKIFIVGELLSSVNANDAAAYELVTVNSGNSVTAVVTLTQVSFGNYLVYARWPTSTGYVYSDPKIPVTVRKVAPNPVAVYDRGAAFTAFRWAFLAYQSKDALLTWNTSQVCTECPACAQASTAASLAYIEGDINGAAYLLTTGQGIVVLSFRGTTDNLQDKLSDADAFQTTYMGCGDVNTCSVHSGFYTVYTAMAPYLIEALHTAIPLPVRSTTPIVVTGHSLGGALATIAAYELAVAGYLVRGVYSFGSPRVGNAAFATAFNMAVGLALPQFYDNIRLPAVTANLRGLGSAGEQSNSGEHMSSAAWPLRPSQVLLSAIQAQGIVLPAGNSDAVFWAAWNERVAGVRLTAGLRGVASRRLFDTTVGAGKADEVYRGSWRIAECSDPFTYLPPENLNYIHVDELVSVDHLQPQVYQQDSPLTCRSEPNSFTSHYEPSYATALLSDAVVDEGSIIYLKSTGGLWTNADNTDCSAVPVVPSDSPSFTPTPSKQPTNTPGVSPSPTPSATSTPSLSASLSLPPSSYTTSPTPSSGATPSLTPLVTTSQSGTPTPPLFENSSSPSPSPTISSTASNGASLSPTPSGTVSSTATPSVWPVSYSASVTPKQPPLLENNEVNERTPAPAPQQSDNTVVIAGSVAGGLALVMAAAGAILYWRSKMPVAHVNGGAEAEVSMSNPLGNFKGNLKR